MAELISPTPVIVVEKTKSRSFLVDITVRLVKEKPLGLIGAIIVLLLFLTGIFADILAPYGYNDFILALRLSPPSATFLLGGDNLGRDLLSRVIYGARISMIVGLAGAALHVIVGTLTGAISGYYGGWVDSILQMITDAVRTVPAIPLFMAIAAFIPDTVSSEGRFFIISLILGFIGWPTLARRVRTHLLTERNQEYVLAAQLCGASSGHIIGRHLSTMI